MKVLILANNDVGLYQFRRELVLDLLKENTVVLSLPNGPILEPLLQAGCKLIDTPGPFEKTILNSYSGFSPLTAGEIVRRAEKKYGQCNPETLYKEFSLFVKDAKNNDYHPVVIMSANGKVMDFSPFHISSTAEFCVTVQVDGISEASDRFYSERESLEISEAGSCLGNRCFVRGCFDAMGTAFRRILAVY